MPLVLRLTYLECTLGQKALVWIDCLMIELLPVIIQYCRRISTCHTINFSNIQCCLMLVEFSFSRAPYSWAIKPVFRSEESRTIQWHQDVWWPMKWWQAATVSWAYSVAISLQTLKMDQSSQKSNFQCITHMPHFLSVALMNVVLQLVHHVQATFHPAWQQKIEEIIKESNADGVKIQGNYLIGSLRGIIEVRTAA